MSKRTALTTNEVEELIALGRGRPAAGDRDRCLLANLSIAGLIGLGLVDMRRRWYLFGEMTLVPTAKGRRAQRELCR